MQLSLRVLGVLFGMSLAVSACNGDEDNNQTSETEGETDSTTGVGLDCDPGTEQACTCSDGSQGTQMCLASGFELGPCMCGDDTTTGMTTGSTSTTDPTSTTTTSTTGSTGSTTDPTGTSTGTSTGTGTSTSTTG